MPPRRRPCRRFLLVEEMVALGAQLEFRDRLVLGLSCNLGVRAGELFGLRWNDIEENRRQIREQGDRERVRFFTNA